MATPNTDLSSIALSDVNVEYNLAANTNRLFNDVFFRSLTGNQQKMIANTPINISDVSDKAAFDGLLAADGDVQRNYGVVTASVVISADSDLITPDMTWSYTVISGGGNITFQPDGGRNATLSLISDAPGVQTANVQVSANLYFQGVYVGSDTKYVNLLTEVYNPNLVITGTAVVNSAGFVAQTAVTQITATSNVVGGSIRFSTSPPFGGVVSGNTISFSAVAGTPGIDNNNIYTLTTDVIYQNSVVASNTLLVNVRAIFQQPDLVVTFPTSTNNVFANSGPINSSLTFTAAHAVPGANIVWSQTLVSGDAAQLIISANQASANLALLVPGFGAKKAIVDVRARLQHSNGYILNERTNRVTLRTVGYGLTFVPATDYTAQGYGAQTAQSSATATYQAGTFSWDRATTAGSSANVVTAIGASSASLTTTVVANTPGTITNTSRINAVISYDGIVVANQSSITTTTAEYTAFMYEVVGVSSNTQVGIAPVTSTINVIGNHNVTNGSITWSSTNPEVQLSLTMSSASLFVTTNTINAQTTTLTGRLFDQYGRLVAERSGNYTVRAFAPNIRFIGANTATVSGYSPPQSAYVAVESRADTGANSFAITTSTVSGDVPAIVHTTGNTTYDKVEFTATANTIGTRGGVQRISATITYFGVQFTQTYDVSVNAVLLNPNFTLTPQNGNVAAINPPVTASANVVPSHTVPGGGVTWTYSTTAGTVLDVPVSNTTLFQYRTQRTSYGSITTNLNVTGTLLDSTGRVVQAITVPVSAVATVNDPQLTISGSTNVSVSNTFQATAATTLTASVAAGITGASFQFSATLVSGSTASIGTNPTQISLSVQANGVQNIDSVYDVTCNCVINGQIVDTRVTRVTLAASATSPTINFSASNGSAADYNFPVTAAARVDASMSPASGTIDWSAAYVTGSGLSGSLNGPNQYVLTGQANDIGAVDGWYDITATYRTPNGTVITTRTARVNVRAERYNPNFSWNYAAGPDVVARGWEQVIQATGVVQASSSVPGAQYVISVTKAGGENAQWYTNDTQAVVYFQNDRNAALHDRAAYYDATCYLLHNGQVLAGPFTRRLNLITSPYWISLTNPNPSGYGYDAPAYASTTMQSNHEAFPGTEIIWNTTKTGGSGNADIYRSNNGGVLNRLGGSLDNPANLGTISSVYSFNGNFYANGAYRSISGTMSLTAESSYSAGSCVTERMWLDALVTAKNAKVGELYMTWTPEDGFKYAEIEQKLPSTLQPCYRITTKNGAVLECSASTPFNLEESKTDLGITAYPSELQGKTVLVDIYGMIFWDEVVEVEDIGEQLVVPISFGGRSFAAGESRMSMVYSHNVTKQIP